jgi:hypothetical protein
MMQRELLGHKALMPFEEWAAPYGFDLKRAECHCCEYANEATQHALMGFIGGYNHCTDERDKLDADLAKIAAIASREAEKEE